MSDEINVIVIKRKGRRFLYLRYECPITGERFEKSSGATTETAARKKAGEWETELKAGGGGRFSAKWDDFRSAYEAATEISLRTRTGDKISAACLQRHRRNDEARQPQADHSAMADKVPGTSVRQ